MDYTQFKILVVLFAKLPAALMGASLLELASLKLSGNFD
jgi:hypothetical protein